RGTDRERPFLRDSWIDRRSGVSRDVAGLAARRGRGGVGGGTRTGPRARAEQCRSRSRPQVLRAPRLYRDESGERLRQVFVGARAFRPGGKKIEWKKRGLMAAGRDARSLRKRRRRSVALSRRRGGSSC